MPERFTSGDPGLMKAVERQMRNWELAQRKPVSEGGSKTEKTDPGVFDFVTIANDVGGGGGDIGNLLGERLGWPVFDREILTAMAGNDEVRARVYHTMDERDLGWFEETMRTLVHGTAHKDDYFHRLTETLLVLARQSHAVFVGRASDLILPKNKGLRVKIVCPYEIRVENFCKHTGATPREAGKQIERIHGERAAFIWKHFKMDILDPTRFDLLINASRFTPAQAVELIMTAMRDREISP